MSSRKKSTSSESSSGSSSDSSSSSGSSSGSDSGSSSSDSDSSSSQDVQRSGPAPPPTQLSENSNSNHKKVPPQPAAPTTNKRSNDTQKVNTTASKPPDDIPKPTPTPPPPPPSTVANKTKAVAPKPVRAASISVYSSEEEIRTKPSNPPPAIVQSNKKTNELTTKKKSGTSNASITSNLSSIANVGKKSTSHNGGGKAPPAIVKQQQQQQNHGHKDGSKTVATSSKNNQSKQAASSAASAKSKSNSSSAASSASKKKSIFSPDNSSESDDGAKSSPAKQTSSPPPPPTQVKTKPAASQSTNNNTNNSAPPYKGRGRPPNRPKVVDKKRSSVSSSASSSSASSSSSESESESSADSSPPSKKQGAKRGSQKSGKDNGSDSDCNMGRVTPNPVRKLTRSASTRKSRHLIGKTSDTESDDRSLSKSPVKRAPGITKGKTKNSKQPVKQASSSVSKCPPAPSELLCPLLGCTSNGHLGGQLEKHFTLEACPTYHNMSHSETKENAISRRAHEEERKLAITAFDPVNKKLTPEQRAYQVKMGQMRTKFKPMTPIAPPGQHATANGNANAIAGDMDIERQPSLNGFVSDYDLRLFQEAQALASEQIEAELKNLPAAKGTKYISMGKNCMEVWYQSPYPDDAARLPKLYLCEFCLRYQKSEVGMKRHAAKCVWRHPPGDEIYRKGRHSVWQVDGKRHKQYCQHLCLLAKFFLDHKTLYYDVEPFLFYVMTHSDSEGCHMVGYFSKEKNSFLNYNVSCILTLPPYQRKGFGRLLIDFSYLLTRVEGKIGSPEKPLSDLGLISYRSYWKDVLLNYLCSRTGTTLSIKDVSQEMAINSYDIVSTLQALGMMKYWKGKHIILKKQDVLEEYAERVKRRSNTLKIDPDCLRWTPFVPPSSQTGPS